jgi:HK97 gp10 family phage protein
MDRVQDEVDKAVREAVKEVAEKALELCRRNVPTGETGRLKRSLGIKYGDGGLSAAIGPRRKETFYAMFVEWGTSQVRPRPFMTPAAEQANAEYLPTIVRKVNEALGKVARG